MARLIKMIKEGEEPIEVSPLTVENHKQLGWKVAGEEPEVEETMEESPKPKRQTSRSKKTEETEQKPTGE